MKPMAPMKPMSPPKRWWPADLGDHPNSSGRQNQTRYAFFGDRRRLAVDLGDGKVKVFNTGDYLISGVQQQQGGGEHNTTFTSQHGVVALDSLKLA